MVFQINLLAKGKTALHSAVAHSNLEGVKALINLGGNLYIRDSIGKRAIDLAKQEEIEYFLRCEMNRFEKEFWDYSQEKTKSDILNTNTRKKETIISKKKGLYFMNFLFFE